MSINPRDIVIMPRKVVPISTENKLADKTAKPVVTDVTSKGMSVTDNVSKPSFDYEQMIQGSIGNSSIVNAKNGKVYLKIKGHGNDSHLKVSSNDANLFLRRQAIKKGITLKDKDLKEINDSIVAYAQMELTQEDIFIRVAPFEDGVEIDLGDESHTHIRITPGNTRLVTSGSDTLFYRATITRPFCAPADKGDISLLRKYLNNIKPDMQNLIIAWITYTLAHPKVSTSKFLHLVLIGSQGSGKSFTCRLLQQLIDPSAITLQLLPRNTKDLVIASQNSHLLLFDNVRKLSEAKSDDLCVSSTGGALSSRKLYSDEDQSISYLHGPLILNGIFDFITAPDLASRSLIIDLIEMNEDNRISEKVLESNLETDLPKILQGVFELIADILNLLPEAKITHPERMIDFSQWLAALEAHDGVINSAYQQCYSSTLKEAQLNTLLDNELAAAIYRLANSLTHDWRGTPAQLLGLLNSTASFQATRSSEWPKSPESISRRLRSFKTALATQGVFLQFYKSKDRIIEISTTTIQEEY